MEIHRKDRLVVCSSPNGRGIAKYAEYLREMVEGTLITCDKRTRWFVLWELFGILSFTRELVSSKELYFSNSRVSPLLWMVLDWGKVTIVVHDVMDTNAERRCRRERLGARMKLRREVNSWILRRSIEKASRIIFNSQYTECEVRRWIDVNYGRTCVIYPPPSFEKLVTKERVKAGRERGGKEILKLLTVTGTTKNKAHEAYKEFHETLEARVGMRIELVIYGIELRKARGEFTSWAMDRRDRVTVKYGRSEEELMEDYLDCDIVVSLSTEEGYGMPVADALGFGIPVVARSIGSYREIKENLDDCGIIHLADDLGQCVERAAKLISESAGKRGREERYERYRRFCRRNRDVANSLLEEMAGRYS